jgi:Kef-type K+ transport system membrane component KefB
LLNYILLAGIAIALGFIVGKGTHAMKITGIVGYILTGIILGPDFATLILGQGSNGIINLTGDQIESITNVALGFVAFVIGGELTLSLLRKMGKSIIAIIIGESIGAFFVVFLGVYLFTNDVSLSILFAAMAPASAPAGAVAVIHEYGAKGKLTNAILAVVGFDDGLAVLIYAFSIAIVGVLLSGVFSVSAMIFEPLIEIGGAILIGGFVGIIFAVVFKRLIKHEEMIALSLAAIFLTAGLSVFFGVSLILSCMMLGMVVINLYPQDNKPVFEQIKLISLPVYILFFVIAGMNLHLGLLLSIGAIGVVYIICRSVGLISGSYLAALASKADPVIRNNIGFGILSQAGVAIGLSLIASHKLSELGYSELGTIIVTTVAATSVVFEIIGPLSARFAIIKSGEAGTDKIKKN